MTRRSLYRFVNLYSGFKLVYTIPDDDFILRMFYADDKLLLLCSKSLWQYHSTEDSFIPAANFFIPTHRPLTNVHTVNAGQLFVTTADSIFSIDLNNFETHAIAFARIASLTSLTAHKIIASNTRLESYFIDLQDQSIKKIKKNSFMPSLQDDFIRIYDGIRLENGNYHLATSRGIMELDTLTQKLHKPEFYYRGEKLENIISVRNLYRDNRGTVYMSHADGIAYYQPDLPVIQYLRSYTNNGSTLPDMDIRSFAEDRHGHLWIGTLNGLARLHRETGKLKTYLSDSENSIEYPSIWQVFYHNDILWIGTSGKGVWYFDERTEKFLRPNFNKDTAAVRLNREFIWRITPLRNGELFVASGGRCYTIDDNKEVTMLARESFKGISRCAMQDSSGRIWHGTATGLNITTDKYELLHHIEDPFPDKRIIAVCEWKKNHFLLGTRGLYKIVLKDNNIESLNIVSSFPPERIITTMKSDAFGQIWIGTDEGLFRYNPQTEETEHFSIADNVQPQSFGSNGLYYSSTGWMYAGGKSGMNYFIPEAIAHQSHSLTPQIISFTIKANDSLFYQSSPPYHLKYSDNNISAEISVPEFEKPYALQYRYKIRDHSDWQYNGHSRFIRLNDILPGKYELTVSVSTDGVRWFEGSQKIPFVIRIPWWQTWWFILSIATLTLLLLYCILHGIKKRRQRREHNAIIEYFAHSTYEHASVEQIVWDLAMNCISRMKFEECVIYLLDPERQVLVQKAAYGPKSPKMFEIANPIEVPLGKGITGTVGLTGKAEIVKDTSKDPRYLIDDMARRSEITVPIIFDDKVIGIIDSEHSRKNFFTEDHLQTLTTIAGICSVKIARGISQDVIKKAQIHLKELNSKMMETKFSNLRLQMNPHFLFNSLSSIQHLVVTEQTKEAYTYLSVFSHFLRSVLQFADKNEITLDEELKMLDMYIQLENLGSDKIFSFDIQVDDTLDTEDVLLPPLMIQPLVENAIWHGLMGKDGERQLTIRFINEEDDMLLCIVDDNGEGRQASAYKQNKEINKFAHSGKAMVLIKERLKLLQQKTGKQTMFEIEDKMENGISSGTRITIKLPFYNPGEL